LNDRRLPLPHGPVAVRLVHPRCRLRRSGGAMAVPPPWQLIRPALQRVLEPAL